MGSPHKKIQLMLEFLKCLFLVLHFSLLYILMIFKYIIAVYADDTTLYPKCDQTSDLWQKL